MDHRKIDTADLDSPRREFFVRSLGFVVAFTVFFGNLFFVCVYREFNPALSPCLDRRHMRSK